jgi:adenine-specific DNA methylase
MPHPPALIEGWLPFDKIGAESLRDASAARKPPLNRLHVWWARRPLTVSRAAIIGSVLPQWSVDWSPALRDRFPSEESYQQWYLHLLGIHGDPVAGRKLIEWAKDKNVQLKSNPYGYDRAFTYNPPQEDLHILRELLNLAWNTDNLTVLDPFAGGGSIPFEALRYGFTTLANELNPVPSVILTATLDYPARFGGKLTAEIRKWGDEWAKRVRERLADYFPKQTGENIQAYIWARTVSCPATGKPVPLSPNWWLSKGRKPVAVRLLTDPTWHEPQFEIVRGKAIDFDPSQGTISRGTARSPWTGETIGSDYIRQEAQVGRMGQMLYAIVVKRPDGFDYRTQTELDLQAATRAEAALTQNLPRWEAIGFVPREPFPEGNDNRPLHYGMPTWIDFFSPRQLLAMGTFVETLRELEPEILAGIDAERTKAVITYLGLALNKCPNYNSRMSVWHALRTSVANTFNRHDFSFAWSHGEFDGAEKLLPWAVKQIVDAYKELANLTTSA